MPEETTGWPDTKEGKETAGKEKSLKTRNRRATAALVRVQEPLLAAPTRASIVNAPETALLAFLQAMRGTGVVLNPADVPLERRVFLSVTDAAKFSGLPLRFLRQLISAGTLQAVRTGAGWRIPRTELEGLPQKLAQIPPAQEELSDAEQRDLAMNKLRRQGLLPR